MGKEYNLKCLKGTAITEIDLCPIQRDKFHSRTRPGPKGGGKNDPTQDHRHKSQLTTAQTDKPDRKTDILYFT